MKDYQCKICQSKFKTKEAQEFHESIPVNELDSKYLFLQNNKKYFSLKENFNISRKHSKIYEMEYFYKYLVESDNHEDFKKKYGKTIPASEIEKKIKSGQFYEVEKEKEDEIFRFLIRNHKIKSGY